MWVKEKLLVTSNFSFSHSVFKRLVSQGRQKVSLCGNGLKLLLFTYGFGYIWIVQDVGDSDLFLASFRQKLIDCYAQKIHYDITSSSKFDHYQHYKSLLDVEQYLSVNLNYMLKRTLLTLDALAMKL